MIRTPLLLALLAASCDITDNSSGDPGDSGGKADNGNTGDVTSIPFSVSRHAWPTGFPGHYDTPALESQDLQLIADLGAKYVRTDAWWYAIEPQPGQFDQAALDQFRWYVEEAGRHGLSVITILSGAPAWAKSLYKDGNRAAFIEAFGAYAERIGATVGDLVTYYQLWNEPNNVTDLPNDHTDVELIRAGRAGLERGRADIGVTQPLRTAINLLVDGHDGPFSYWEDDLAKYMDLGARDAIDIIAIDYYPGTWSVGNWGGDVIDRLYAQGAKYHKAVAVYETGYTTSSCVMPLHTQNGQAAWIRTQMPRLRAKIRDRNLSHGVKFEQVNWFKIEDRNTENCFSPEDNFGVVHSDRTKKPGYDVLKAEIAQFATVPMP